VQYLALFQKTPERAGEFTQIPPSDQPPVNYKIQEIASNLFVPWSIVFTGNNRFLVSERNGNIRVVENNSIVQTPLGKLDVSQSGEEGLMGLAADPDYTSTGRIFACLVAESDDALEGKVISFIDKDNKISEITTLIDKIPAAQYHAGCRLIFIPDKTLLITTGEATNKNLAQDTTSLGGKILRINRDGSIPSDNPFPNSPIWTYGHRNPQGLAYDTIHNILWETEHGPSIFDGPAGGDEINIITKGENYGWPIIYHKQKQNGLISPLLEFTPAVAPSGMLYYTGTVFPQFTNKLLFAALKGEGLYLLSTDRNNPKIIKAFEKLKDISVGRLREVIQAPDGTIYFTTSNRDARGTVRSNDDKIYQLVPTE
jgi:glucose/arabinose dehydrogenase